MVVGVPGQALEERQDVQDLVSVLDLRMNVAVVVVAEQANSILACSPPLVTVAAFVAWIAASESCCTRWAFFAPLQVLQLPLWSRKQKKSFPKWWILTRKRTWSPAVRMREKVLASEIEVELVRVSISELTQMRCFASL